MAEKSISAHAASAAHAASPTSDIAQGTADFYFTLTNKIKQWDTAAAYCILREAGGRMTDMLGGELVYNTEDVYHQHGILASNGVLHDAVARLYKNLN